MFSFTRLAKESPINSIEDHYWSLNNKFKDKVSKFKYKDNINELKQFCDDIKQLQDEIKQPRSFILDDPNTSMENKRNFFLKDAKWRLESNDLLKDIKITIGKHNIDMFISLLDDASWSDESKDLLCCMISFVGMSIDPNLYEEDKKNFFLSKGVEAVKGLYS